MPEARASSAVSELCPRCGLCCNGALFADVELKAGDPAQRLAALGLAVERKGRRLAFAQPCACFAGDYCRVYPERPRHCRAFECRVLKRVAAGALARADALETIGEAQRQIRRVAGIMRSLGNTDEHLSLTRRYARIMAEPMDLGANASHLKARARLMSEMDALMRMLEREFR